MRKEAVWVSTGFCLCLAFLAVARGGDWPQILGVHRDGHAVQETLVPWSESDLAASGELPVLWRFACGAGYSGVAVADERVFVWHRSGAMEHLDCVNAADGKSLWRASFATRYAGGIDPDEGPRCVPVVHDGKVFVYGVGRDVHAVSVEDGRKIWSRELKSDYGAEDGYFGAGSTPLVLQDRLIVCVGGGKQSGVVALDLATGETLWQALDSEASYASPVAIKVAGRECLLAVMRLEAYLLDPSNGAEINRVRFGARGPTVNAATPIVDGAEAFLTASYGIGCRKLDFAAQQVANAWLDDEVISSQYVTPVRVGDFLYGITGREDMRNAGLICVDWKAGKVQWRQADYGTAHLIAAGDRLLVQSVAGKLEVLAADPQSYRVLSSARLPVGVYRALPALADGIYFGRRTISATEGEIVAVRVGQKSQ